MNHLSPKESRLIRVFLNEFKKMVQERKDVPFNPRSLTIISQPYVEDDSRFDFITYNKWFDEMDIQTDIGTCNNILQTYLEVPITMLIDAEESGKPLMSDKDSKKLMKALKLIRSIRLEKQK
jgi:hypothetical protein